MQHVSQSRSEEFISSDLDAQSLTNKARQLSKEGMVNKIESIFGKDAASKFKTYMDESANMFPSHDH